MALTSAKTPRQTHRGPDQDMLRKCVPGPRLFATITRSTHKALEEGTDRKILHDLATNVPDNSVVLAEFVGKIENNGEHVVFFSIRLEERAQYVFCNFVNKK